MANIPDSASSPIILGTACGTIPAAVFSHSSSQRLRSTGACQSASTLSFANAALMHTGPCARSARTMSDETPPASGVIKGVSPASINPIRSSAERKGLLSMFVSFCRNRLDCVIIFPIARESGAAHTHPVDDVSARPRPAKSATLAQLVTRP